MLSFYERSLEEKSTETHTAYLKGQYFLLPKAVLKVNLVGLALCAVISEHSSALRNRGGSVDCLNMSS